MGFSSVSERITVTASERGILTIPGFSKGKTAAAPITVGLKIIKRIDEASPV